ncbi:molybdopterin-dependent oxidoreductase [Denitromonas sp.]|uniref:molybdopterin-dependent oxidoreductase n=1 Tax=Denitromonas sp. TaxID=2734609 RepID=UPI002FDD993A
MATETIPTYCALCISRCGCLASVTDGRLVGVAADHAHPTGRAICIKAKAAPELVAHPERLTTPLLRTRPKGDADPGWRPIGWDEANALIAARLQAAGAEGTAFAVTTPSGTAIADSFAWIHRLVHAWGSPNLVFATENCNWHRDFGPQLTWGRGLGMPDYAHTETILLWGCNPTATWLAHAERVRAAQRRGARLIVVDPRRAGLAMSADVWLPVRPGCDNALALGLIHLLLAAGGADLDFLRQHTDAFSPAPSGGGTVLDQLTERAGHWPPARVAAVTGVAEETLHATVALLAESKPVSLYTWTGTCQQQQATAATRAINLLYALTGSLGQPGGNRWFPKPKINDVSAFDRVTPHTRQRTLGLAERPLGPPSRGWITTRDLFKAIDTGQPYPIRALVAFGGNFMVTKPATQHAEAALAKLDFFVQSELFETPSTRWADLLLPAASCWEREGLQAGFMVDAAADAYVQLRPAVVPPPGEARSDTAIIFGLAQALGLGEHFFDGDEAAALAYQLAPSGLDAATLRAHPRGMVAPQLTDEASTPQITLWSSALAELGEDALPQWQPPAPDPALPFSLTCGKVTAYCHSQYRQIDALRRRQPEPIAELAPDVATLRGIASGSRVVVQTANGEMHYRAEINPRLAGGTVWAQYGWWQADVAIDYNAAMDGEHFDSVSGSNALRGVACDIRMLNGE